MYLSQKMEPKFQRRIEDFICGNCGNEVKGSGYTNHCPVCLWSQHVDINPGDRAEDCRGLMKPIAVEMKKGKYRLLHRCEECKSERWNGAAKEDSFEIILQISAEQNI
jgi:ribosomal protein L37AE/L43A